MQRHSEGSIVLNLKNEVIVTPLRLRKETVLELEYNLMLFRLGNQESLQKSKKTIFLE